MYSLLRQWVIEYDMAFVILKESVLSTTALRAGSQPSALIFIAVLSARTAAVSSARCDVG